MPSRTLFLALGTVVVVAAAAIWWTIGRQPSSPSVPESVDLIDGPAMGSRWLVKLGRPIDSAADRLKAPVQGILDRIDGQMSTWNPSSDLSRFNAHRGTDWFPVPGELAAVVMLAQRISAETDGAFDITVGPLVNLWGFSPQGEQSATSAPAAGDPAMRVPSDESIAAAKAHVGYKRLEARSNPPALRKLDPDVYVDLSAIAQGHAADEVARHLDAAGIADYLIDTGEIRARGRSPKGRPWHIGIQTPTPDTLRTLGGVELRDVAVSTSGDYKNFFDHAGVRYSHAIDPRTGRPIQHQLAQVCVAHPSAAYADAMATALLVLGADAGYELAERRKLAALFIVREEGRFQMRATPTFAAMQIAAPGTATTQPVP